MKDDEQQIVYWHRFPEVFPNIEPNEIFYPLLFMVKGCDNPCAGRIFIKRPDDGVQPSAAFLQRYEQEEFPLFISLQGRVYSVKEVTHWMEIPNRPKGLRSQARGTY